MAIDVNDRQGNRERLHLYLDGQAATPCAGTPVSCIVMRLLINTKKLPSSLDTCIQT